MPEHSNFMKKSSIGILIGVFVFGVVILFLAFENFEMFQEIPEEQTSKQIRPNIVVIMTDDLDVKTLDVMLSKNLMPNLQEFIINKGTEFTNSFVTTPMCCPSRATFLTGQYPHNHNVLTNQDILKLDDDHTLATWLHEAGYRTGIIGKYLNKYGVNVEATYIPPGWDSWQVLVEPFINRVYGYKMNQNGNIAEYGNKPLDYQTDVIAILSKKFIAESDIINDDTPFFLVITPLAPHKENVTEGCYIFSRNLSRIIRGPERYQGTSGDIQLPLSPSFNQTDKSNFGGIVRYKIPFTLESLNCLELLFQNRIGN